jgi:hypothetical protein
VSGQASRRTPCGPYETEQQARADVAHIHEQARRSIRRGVLAEANHARLMDACQDAGVTPGAFDAKILAWLANYEPETCAVVTGLIKRANTAGLAIPVPKARPLVR